MALRGTLKDMAIIELFQFPYHGKKTGELLVSNGRDEARLYYEKGQMIHAIMGSLQGHHVLVEIVGWVDGEFEFRPDVQTAGKSIEMDLHRALMNALKSRDEQEASGASSAPSTRPAASDSPSKPASPPAASPSPQSTRDRPVDRPQPAPSESKSAAASAEADNTLATVLQKAMDRYEEVIHVSLIDREGLILAETNGRHSERERIAALRQWLTDMAKTATRSTVRRALYEDEDVAIALVRIDDSCDILVAGSGDVAIGAISLLANKILRAIVEA